MGNCCDPPRVDQSSEARSTELVGKTKDPRGTALNATSAAGLREKYEQWLNDKDEAIRKNETEAETKEQKLRELQQAGKPLDCERMKRQIDTHRKLIRQAKDEKAKIQ